MSSKISLLDDLFANKSIQYAPTFSPTTSRTLSTTSNTANTSTFSPTTTITYPQYAIQISSPFAGIDQSNAITQKPSIMQNPGLTSSTDQAPTTSPKTNAGATGISGLNPIWLVAGAVAVVIVFVLVSKK